MILKKTNFNLVGWNLNNVCNSSLQFGIRLMDNGRTIMCVTEMYKLDLCFQRDVSQANVFWCGHFEASWKLGNQYSFS